MPRRIVIIGGVALGPKVACRARRLDPEAQVTMIDRDSIISYGGCGIPYYVSGDVADAKELCTTVYHAVRDPEFFRHYKRVQVATETEALAIDRRAKTVRVRDLKTDAERELEYDTLVLATGSTPFVPPVPGVDLPGVYTVANLHKAVLLKDKISSGEVDAAVVIGGGAIGLEMAEALTALWGIKTTLVEMCDQVLPQALGPELARMVENHLSATVFGSAARTCGSGAAPRAGTRPAWCGHGPGSRRGPTVGRLLPPAVGTGSAAHGGLCGCLARQCALGDQIQMNLGAGISPTDRGV